MAGPIFKRRNAADERFPARPSGARLSRHCGVAILEKGAPFPADRALHGRLSHALKGTESVTGYTSGYIGPTIGCIGLRSRRGCNHIADGRIHSGESGFNSTAGAPVYDIIAILIPVILIVAIVLIVRTLSDAALRRRLTETQTDAEVIRALLETGRRQREQSALSWSVMLIAVGSAAVMIGALDIGSDNPIAFGLLFIAAGFGILLSLILGRLMK
ncbi:MAG: hypothetical protein ACPGJE_04825 [Wenzhouxiangellaceae bacterium]